ncbi:MAG TPA: DUF501 domain-containing protein [Ilumatobacter sp.]|nr:DUF501 domain-containing protein [Ilumatobacter sp.]
MDDKARVAELLGRRPQGRYEVVVRDADGDPVVLRNAPLLDDGTPMPTRYWLISPAENRRIGRLEADGGVDAAEAAVDPIELAAAHDRYAAERDRELPADHTGPRPSGGVGGTRTGVKCLHAHWAWYLAGGDDPIGRWIAEHVDERPAQAPAPVLTIEPERLQVTLPSGATAGVPWGPANLTAAWLAKHDPPWAADLTNALGTITDHLDDVEREHPEWAQLTQVTIGGPAATALARLEVGHEHPEGSVEFTRQAAEEVFRLVATERAADRAANPGLPSHHVDTIVATCVIVVAVMRHRDLPAVTLLAGEAE